MIQLGSILAVVWLYRAKVLDASHCLDCRRVPTRGSFAFMVRPRDRCLRWSPGALFSKFVKQRALWQLPW